MSYQNDVYEVYDWDGQNVVYVPKDGIRGAAYMNEYGNGYHPSIALSNTSYSNSNNIMPIPLIAAGIGALGGILGGVISQSSQEKSNSKMMREQARIQREQFDYTNAYNTPAQQVNRLIEAGLNPNLLYGSSHPTGTASMPQVSAQRGVPLDLDLQSALRFSLDAMRLEKENRLVEQQIENMKQQNRSLDLDNQEKEAGKPYFKQIARDRAWMLTAQRLIQEHENEIKTWDAWQAKNSQRIYDQLMEEGLIYDFEKAKYSMPIAQWKKAEQEVELVKKEISRVGQIITNLGKEGRILEYRAELADAGINPDDPIWARAIGIFLDEVFKRFGLGGTVGAIKKGAGKVHETYNFIKTPVRDLIGK